MAHVCDSYLEMKWSHPVMQIMLSIAEYVKHSHYSPQWWMFYENIPVIFKIADMRIKVEIKVWIQSYELCQSAIANILEFST